MSTQQTCLSNEQWVALRGQSPTSKSSSGIPLTSVSHDILYCCHFIHVYRLNNIKRAARKSNSGQEWWCFHTRARQRQDKCWTQVHFYYAFHTRSDKPGVKGIIEIHRFNFCLVVLSLSCSGVKAPWVPTDWQRINPKSAEPGIGKTTVGKATVGKATVSLTNKTNLVIRDNLYMPFK